MVDTIKFSQMTDGGNINNNDVMPSLLGGVNVLLNNPWTFLPPGDTASRPAPSTVINYRLRFNTDTQLYEYYDAVVAAWTQLQQNVFTSGPFLIYTADPSIPDGQNLGALSNGILKQTISSGIATLNIAIQGTDYYGPGDSPTFSGITLTGNLDMGGFTALNAANPVNPQDYATKFYVDQTALTGTSVYAASAGSLGTVTQSGSGIGATITNAGAQAVFALDGVNPPVGSNVLIKNTATGMSSANEGIYTVVDVGSVSTNWQIIRATGYDTAIEVNNTGLIVVQNGSTLAGTGWYNSTTIVTMDVTAFNFAQFGTGGTITSLSSANSTITLTPNPITTMGTIAVNTSSFIRTVKVQIFTSNGTYTPSTGMIYCRVRLAGGGAGTGGTAATSAAQTSASGGGGGGGYSESILTAATVGASQSITIGAGGAAGTTAGFGGTGGTTSFGAILSATGGIGSASQGAIASTLVSASVGGAGGIGSGGNVVNLSGSSGGYGLFLTNVPVGGMGGASLLSGSINNIGNGSASPGQTGLSYGGGASGSASQNSIAQTGSPGFAGVVIVEEFCNV